MRFFSSQFYSWLANYLIDSFMNNDEFKQRLSQVAEWCLPVSPGDSVNITKKKRSRQQIDDEDQEDDTPIEVCEDRLQPMVTKIHIQPVDCTDCGQLCANGRRTELQVYSSNNKRHWRERCVTCNKVKNPYTGEFDLKPSEAAVCWNSFNRTTKMTYATKGNVKRKEYQLASQPGGQQEETDQGIITCYPDYKDHC
jgi:hypothetical protein